jgi:imidazolonepropionase-like amidohydrolase
VAVHSGTLDRSGTIETGKRADLVLLQANPLQDIRNTSRIAGVKIGGRWLPKTELDKRLQESR